MYGEDDLLERLPRDARAVVEACGQIAVDRGEHAYLVGGPVRDLILERGHLDIDVVVEGDGMAVAQALARSTNGKLTRHHAFRTARVDWPEGFHIDVATARAEEYPRPGHLPRVVPGTLAQDLERRDFSINTMALSLSPEGRGELIDPHGGLADLEAGLVRVLHGRSFADDPTRIFRALRFVQRFGYRLEEDTAGHLDEALEGGYLDTVSADRVRRELVRSFSEEPVQGPLTLQAWGVLHALCDGLEADEGRLEALREARRWYREVLAEQPETSAVRAPAEADWAEVLASCAWGLAPQQRWQVVRRMGLTRDEREPLIECGKRWRQTLESWRDRPCPDPVDVDRSLRVFRADTLLVVLSGPDAAEDPELSRAIRSYLETYQWVRPATRGEDLLGMGVPEGPEVGEALEMLRRARLQGLARDAEEERHLVRTWLAERP